MDRSKALKPQAQGISNDLSIKAGIPSTGWVQGPCKPRSEALVLSIAEDGTCRVVHETSLPGQRLFLSTALSTEKTAKVVAYRPVPQLR